MAKLFIVNSWGSQALKKPDGELLMAFTPGKQTAFDSKDDAQQFIDYMKSDERFDPEQIKLTISEAEAC